MYKSTAASFYKAIIVGLHPGNVDSKLAKPFQDNVPDGKLLHLILQHHNC